MPWLGSSPITITVVSAATGEPVPHAEIRWHDAEDAWTWFDSLIDIEGPRRASDSMEGALYTDSAGRVSLPSCTSPTLIEATLGSAIGFGTVEQSPFWMGMLQVPIAEPTSVTVHVKDLSGALGVGVPVSLERQVSGYARAAQPKWVTLLTLPTDETGTVEFRYANLLVPSGAASSSGPSAKHRVRIASMAHESKSFEIDWSQSPDATITATVDLGVDTTLRFEDAFGYPIESLSTLLPRLGVRLPELGQEIARGVEDGALWLGRLPRGALGRLSSSPTPLGSWSLPDFTTTTEPTNSSTIRVPLTFGGTTFVGRFVDGQGAPLANHEVEVGRGLSDMSHTGGVRRIHSPTLRSGPDGRFILRLRTGTFALRGATATSAWLAFGDGDGTSPRGWTGDLLGQLDSAPIELGDVPLTMAPLLLRAVVIDELGAPIEGAEVLVSCTFQLPVQEATTHSPINLTPYAVKTDGNGEFELHGESAPASLDLTISSPDHLTHGPFRVQLGERTQRLTLFRAGALSGYLDPSMGPGWSVRLTLAQPANPSDELPANTYASRPGSLRTQRTSGPFAWRNLIPGHYRLALQHESSPTPLAEFGDLFVRPGETLVDPRLQGLCVQAAR